MFFRTQRDTSLHLISPRRSLQLFEEHAWEYERLSQPGPLKIGIQIRTGDQHIGKDGDGINLKTFDHFFDCATQVQVRRTTGFLRAKSVCTRMGDHCMGRHNAGPDHDSI